MIIKSQRFSSLILAVITCFSLVSCKTSVMDNAVTNSTSQAETSAITTTESSMTTIETTDHITTETPIQLPPDPPYASGDHTGYEIPDDPVTLGQSFGVMPGRVVWAWDPDCYNWNGSGYWWTSTNFNLDRIATMMSSSVAALAGKDTAKDGWDAIFRDHNERIRGLDDKGYTKGEKIAIKTNMNGAGTDNLGISKSSFSSPAAVRALLLTLVNDVGVAPSDITVFDASRVMPGYLIEMCSEGVLKGVRFVWNDAKGNNDAVIDYDAPVIWSETFDGEQCYLPTCLTDATYLINFCTVKGHDLAGVTLTAKNHFGTILNSDRNNPPQAANILGFITAHDFHWQEGWSWPQRAMNTYTVLTDFLASQEIGAKTVLNIGEMIVTARTQGSNVDKSTKFTQAPFNGDWPCSLFLSQDPIALDSVAYDFLNSEPAYDTAQDYYNGQKSTAQNYIHESALAYNPPSGTYYKDGHGNDITYSLGVHEHWNNANDKMYSRNLGKDEGIELYRITVD